MYIITFTVTSFSPTPLHAFLVKGVLQDELVNKKVMAQNNSMLGTFCHRTHRYRFYFSDISICTPFPSAVTLKTSVKSHPNLNQHFSAASGTTQAQC